MALRVLYKKKQGKITMKSGHAYRFRYSAWQNDPEPTYIHLYSFTGTHPTTGRQWRFHQGINLTYIPRSQRKAFANIWVDVLKKMNGNVKFSWQHVLRYFPYLKYSVRRYFYSPSYYITKIREIPFDENFEKNVVSTFSKDFSKKLKVSLMGKFRKALGQKYGPPGRKI